jgi:hypothetical protein
MAGLYDRFLAFCLCQQRWLFEMDQKGSINMEYALLTRKTLIATWHALVTSNWREFKNDIKGSKPHHITCILSKAISKHQSENSNIWSSYHNVIIYEKQFEDFNIEYNTMTYWHWSLLAKKWIYTKRFDWHA